MSVTSVETPVRVLIIDDNLQNREVAEGHLVGAGYQAIQAEGGEQGLTMIEEQRPDLVLLDVLMPGHGRLRDLPPDPHAAGRGRHAGAVPDRARRSGHAQAGAGFGRGRLPDQADQPDRAPDPRALVAADQADVRRAEAELRRHPRAARRAAGREPAEGRADRADRPRSQEPAVQHPVERAVRAGPQAAGRRGERFAGGHPARVAVDGAAGDEPAGRVAQRGRRADPARDRVRPADAADRGVQGDGAAGRGQGPAPASPRSRRDVGPMRGDRDLDPAGAREPDRQRVQVRAAAHDDQHRDPAGDDGRRRRARRRDPRARRGRGRSRAVPPADLREVRPRGGPRGRRGPRQPRAGPGVLPARRRRSRRRDLGGGRRRSRRLLLRAAPRARLPLSEAAGPPLGAPRGGLAV